VRPVVCSSLPAFVTFLSSAFNTTEPKKYFISPRAFGDDVANWLMNDLAQRNAALDPTIGQKDFGWYVRFRLGRASYQFVVGYTGPDWIGKLERRWTIFEWLFHLPNKDVEEEAFLLIHETLASSDLISHIRWHYQEDFDAPVM
jgi:hypothetical protein